MNTERDKFLTESIGLCYHNWLKDEETGEWWDEKTTYIVANFECSKCHDYIESHFIRMDSYPATPIHFPLPQENFSNWSGFGKLFEWANKQPWIGSFAKSVGPWQDKDNMSILLSNIDPDKFADALYIFLKERN